MSIKRKKLDNSTERAILVGLIISDQFLREIQPIFKLDLLEIQYGSIIADWCLRFYDRYQKAPGKAIQQIFTNWCKTNPNPDVEQFVEDFLENLSEEYENASFNADYMLDKAIQHFKSRSLKLLAEDIEASISQNDVESAEKALNEFHRVERLTGNGIEPFEDRDAWRSAFEKHNEPLFKVPGKLGDMINGELCRDSLVSILGAAKSGKSWALQFLGHCALRARCNVAEFQVGDLSEGQRLIRDGIYITQKSNKKKYCGDIHIPILDCLHNQKGTCEAPKKRKNKIDLLEEDDHILDFDEIMKDGYKPCISCLNDRTKNFKGAVWYEKRKAVEPLTWGEAFKAVQEYKERINAKKYKLATYSSNSVNISGIISQLDVWERTEGFIPDVIIIDYADILAPEKNYKEERTGINETWAMLRKLSQDRHACVITATQANGDAIKDKSRTIGREHYSGDRRKFDHVTAMYGLSQTQTEKKKGVVRWGAIVVREDNWNIEHQVSVLGQLAIGRPYLDSFLGDILEKEKKSSKVKNSSCIQ